MAGHEQQGNASEACEQGADDGKQGKDARHPAQGFSRYQPFFFHQEVPYLCAVAGVQGIGKFLRAAGNPTRLSSKDVIRRWI